MLGTPARLLRRFHIALLGWIAALQVMVAEVDSHKAFRLVSDLKALAVLLRDGVTIPAPYQLAASLKQQQSTLG
jgi:hypothetical protein